MDTCGEIIDRHFEEQGPKYYIGIISIQLLNFAFYVIAIITESSFDLLAYQYYKFATLSLLISSMTYFLWVAIFRSSPVDLFTFLILSTICNCYMIFRDTMFFRYPYFFLTVDNDSSIQPSQFWFDLTAIDIIICVVAQILYFYLAKPTFMCIYKVAFYKLGQRRPLWKVYKHFSLFLSMIKVDFILNLFYVATTIYFTYYDRESLNYMIIDIVFFGIIVGTTFYAIKSIILKNEKGYFWICILRIVIELIKIVKCILILMGINAQFDYSEAMIENLGKIKYSVLVQEIISIGLFMPMLALGRFIFMGFSIKKFDEIFDTCISLHHARKQDRGQQLLLEKVVSSKKDEEQKAVEFKEQILNQFLINVLRRRQIVVPKKEIEFRYPVLREQEYNFVFFVLKLLNIKLQTENQINKEKRRKALLANDQQDYIKITKTHLKLIEANFSEILFDLSEDSNTDYFDILSVIQVVYSHQHFLPNILLTIREKEQLSRLPGEIDLLPLKGALLNTVEQERQFIVELAQDTDITEVLKNKYLEFCRTEDRLYFDNKIEYVDIKKSKDFQLLFENDFEF